MTHRSFARETRAAEARTEAKRRAGAANDSKFAALDALSENNPKEFEQALAKLSPTELDAYLASR
jgi:hypothetical protein